MGAYDNISTDVKLNLSGLDGNLVFGPGIAALCRGVRDHGSLNRAAKSMGMAYSKAWRIVKESEAGLGFSLLDRDGARGSSLTPEGDKLLSAYDALLADITEYADSRFHDMLK